MCPGDVFGPEPDGRFVRDAADMQRREDPVRDGRPLSRYPGVRAPRVSERYEHTGKVCNFKHKHVKI